MCIWACIGGWEMSDRWGWMDGGQPEGQMCGWWTLDSGSHQPCTIMTDGHTWCPRSKYYATEWVWNLLTLELIWTDMRWDWVCAAVHIVHALVLLQVPHLHYIAVTPVATWKLRRLVRSEWAFVGGCMGGCGCMSLCVRRDSIQW